MDRVALKTHAKKQIKGTIFTLLGMYIIIGVIEGLINLIFPPLAWVIIFIISGPIAYAFAKTYLNITRGSSSPKIEDLIIGFKDGNFTRTFVAFIRYEVFIFLWTLLFIIPGIIKTFSYSMMFLLLADNPKMTAGEAQKRSMELMDGHKMELFVLYLSFIPWYLLGCITFGIAMIYVTPYVETTKAEFYRNLIKEAKATKKD